jgi:hypothetical protein
MGAYGRVPARSVLSLSVRLHEDGPVAQLGARLDGIQEVTGSNPVRSTNPSLRSVRCAPALRTTTLLKRL